MKQHQTPIGKTDEWLTPPEIIARLGRFDLDPCAPVNRPWPTANEHYTVLDNGLSRTWFGRVWLNPPFSRQNRPKWMRRMAEYGNGIMLIPAATETKAFFRDVWECASSVCFVRGRPHFCDISGRRSKANCGTAIALVAYGDYNTGSLIRADLGKVITLMEADNL